MRIARISHDGVEDEVTRGVSIADELRRMIQSGELAPGMRLRQAEYAQRFGTSITPVREAFAMLIRQGLLRKDSHRSPAVARPTLFDLRDNIDIRIALEGLAARRAAERATADQVASLQALVDSPNAAANAGIHFGNDRAFHAALYALAGNAQLAELIGSLRDAAYVYLQFEGPAVTPRHLDNIRKEHSAIVLAIGQHDAALAEHRVTEHLRASLERAMQLGR